MSVQQEQLPEGVLRMFREWTDMWEVLRVPGVPQLQQLPEKQAENARSESKKG